MKKANLRLALSSLTFIGILKLLRNVILRLTGNAHFSTPLVPLSGMTVLADDLELAILEATQGSLTSRIKRDKLIASAKSMLTSQANYVRAVSNGDIEMLESSGFELAKMPERAGVPLAPDSITIRATNIATEVEMRWPKREGALGYRVFKTDQAPTDGTVWDYVDFTSRVSFKMRGLESFKPYWFSITSIGAAGESDLSKASMGRAA